MTDFDEMAWAYSDSMRNDETTKNDDIATAYAKGFMAGAKAFTAYLKEKFEKSGDADFVFWTAELVFNGSDMYEREE